MGRRPSLIATQMKLASALLLASIAACGGPLGDEQVETTDALYGVGSSAKAWPLGVAPTCWVDPDDRIDLQIRVRQILRETWESYANVSFTGTEPSLPFGGLWASCAGTPATHIAVAFSKEANFRGKTVGGAATGALVTLISDRALDVNYERFRYEVIHEFGHALGFAHEMQRPDNWNGNTAYQCPGDGTDPANYNRVLGGLYLTPTYDVNSIMNYCNPAGYPQDLSLGDISGVRAVYGRRDVKGVLYAVDSDGQLEWYHHDGRENGAFAWGYRSGNIVGTGWAFKQLFSGSSSDGVLYGVDATNNLHWYRNAGRMDGSFRWEPGSGNIVGTGWDFETLFSGGDGIIYGITPVVPATPRTGIGPAYAGHAASGGELKWYRHTGRGDGSFKWASGSGSTVGTGWGGMKQVFSGGDGVIYLVMPNGDLKWYKHTGRLDGSFIWATGSGNVVGTGWGSFKRLFSGGEGVIYGIDQNDQLLWYRHTGRTDGSFRWAPGSGNVVGTGWAFTQLLSDD